MKEFFTSLTKKIKEKDKIVLMTHKNMDLDGFSSSICLYNIISNMHNKECYIYLSDIQNNDGIKNIVTIAKTTPR